MIIARFMEISLDHARIQVNTWRGVTDRYAFRPDVWMVLSLWHLLAGLGVYALSLNGLFRLDLAQLPMTMLEINLPRQDEVAGDPGVRHEHSEQQQVS